MTENWLISKLVIIDTIDIACYNCKPKSRLFSHNYQLKCHTFHSHGFSEFSFEKNVIPFFSELCRCNSMVLTRIQKGENLFPLALQFHFIEREQSPIWTRDEHCIECTCSSSVPPLAKNICNVPFCSMYSSIRMNVDLSWLMIRTSLITQSRGTY